MSKPSEPVIRPSKSFIPGSYRSGPAGLPQDVKNFNLNRSGNINPIIETLSPGIQQAQSQKKIGRVQLWIRRNPYKFHFTAVGLGLLIFFNKFLYDLFIKESKVGPRVKERGYRPVL